MKPSAALLSVMFEVMPGGVLGMVGGMHAVRVRQVSVVRGLLMVARIMVLRCFCVVVRSQAVMMGRSTMLVRCLL